jgi:CheY-like chemotaxis protein
MTGMRRQFGLIAIFAALSLPASASAASDAQDTFREGVELLRQGNDAAALEKFAAALAEDMSNEDAYELWKSTDHDIWIDMLVKSGQFELIAKRFMGKAELGRVEQADDEATIRGLLRDVQSDDAMKRTKAVRILGANHGEYAVQYMLDSLADENADDRRVMFMHALTEMGTDVVLPLIAALDSDDAYLRRNVALILGYIGDTRAQAALTWHTFNDADEGVQLASAEAAKKCGSMGEALALFLQLGDDYHHGRASVLRPVDYSEVVWSWGEGGLESRAVPRFLYADELSKNAYYSALQTNPSSVAARAGLARAYVSQQAEIELLAGTGADVSAFEEQVAEASIAVNTAGADALELALSWCVAQRDSITGVGLIRLLGQSAKGATPSLQAALASDDGALKGEAAVALGRIALRNHAAPGAEVVRGLGQAAGREIMSIGVVIDANKTRGAALAEAMASRGMLTNHWTSGASGLALLKRVPGVDVIVLAGELPDLTADQVLYELASDERTANTPVVVVSDSEDYADRVAAVISGADGIDAILGAVEADADSDRSRADELGARAAQVLAGLAQAGNASLEVAVAPLASTLAGRRDEVAIPAMQALAYVGTVAQLGNLQAVLIDDGRSDAARVGAADAIASIANRLNLAGTEGLVAGLAQIIDSESGASLAVRVAASRALSSLAITDVQRAAIAVRARIDVRQ